MPLDWILSPIAQYGLLAVALAGGLVLFLCVKREIAVARRSFTQGHDSAEAKVAALAEGLAALRREMETAGAAPRAGQKLNMTRRAQALRMQRCGEAPATIAATLRLPRNEVDLMLKIQKLTQSHAAPPANDRMEWTQIA